MTRIERIREYLLEHGPQTNRQIAAAFGWPINTSSAAVSHARTYGYVEVAGRVPVPFGARRCPEFLYQPRAFIIRKPAQ